MKNVINKIIVTLFVITLVTTVFNILPKSLANSNGDYTYDVRDDGTIEITKYNGSASNLNSSIISYIICIITITIG